MLGYYINGLTSTTLDEAELNPSKESIREAFRELRKGIGYRSKVLLTHPSNLEKVRELVKVQTTPVSPDVHIPFPIRVMTSGMLQKHRQVQTSVKYNDTRFCRYSSGPADGSKLTVAEYESMCLYFGWASPVYEQQPLFYEMNTDYYDLLKNLRDLPLPRVADPVYKRVMDFITDRWRRDIDDKILGEVLSKRVVYGSYD
jgi:hypothetical protein